MKFICLDLEPFRIVEKIGFKQLIKELEPRYTLPARDTIRNVHLNNLYK